MALRTSGPLPLGSLVAESSGATFCNFWVLVLGTKSGSQNGGHLITGSRRGPHSGHQNRCPKQGPVLGIFLKHFGDNTLDQNVDQAAVLWHWSNFLCKAASPRLPWQPHARHQPRKLRMVLGLLVEQSRRASHHLQRLAMKLRAACPQCRKQVCQYPPGVFARRHCRLRKKPLVDIAVRWTSTWKVVPKTKNMCCLPNGFMCQLGTLGAPPQLNVTFQRLPFSGSESVPKTGT